MRRRLRAIGSTGRGGLRRGLRLSVPIDDARTVLGTGRSGTTWLLELLSNDPRIIPVFEPLRAGSTPRGQFPSIRGYHAVRPHEERPELEEHLRRVFSGRVLDGWTAQTATVRQVLLGERVVAKMIRLCGSAGWLEARFPTVRSVAVVRHPCAVVASMCAAEGTWRHVPQDFFRDYVEATLDIRADDLLGPGDPDEVRRFAALWAADNAALIRDTTPGRTLLVGYEELVRDPIPQLEAIDHHLELGLHLGSIDVKRASTTSTDGRNVPTVSGLGSWRQRLSLSDIDTILGIVREVGVAAVTDDPVVDMDAHRSLQVGRLPEP